MKDKRADAGGLSGVVDGLAFGTEALPDADDVFPTSDGDIDQEQ